ncbi:methyltransferase domain-containing protein [Candidimonas sp. SYP-B2681]|uniref:spermidine synthase n=1 Tax=Candidimonas sp. SYP-B2681 TaxID=2497686 RepID=UPI000F88B2C4|nr:fused MFS/spermidine synthase [Candidimonas sp. SYP-B2681]RTZ38880.1 methyltransferase domain-containing protein [Candidimonas sp. SYP-B2681]
MAFLRSLLAARPVVACVLAACFALITTLALLDPGSAAVIHTEQSEFAPVVVFEELDQRCMNFNSPEDLGRQSCIDLDDPDELVFSYTRTMMSALFVNPEPAHVLIVGLGGGSLSRALAKVLPEAVIDTVEIDPAVVNVAKKFFGYMPSAKQRIFVEDGRAFIERAHRQGQQYDLIMLDAFDVDYIPPHLLTREFLQHVYATLTPGGVLVANTFSRSHVYDQESATYADVFGKFFNLRGPNRIIMARRGSLPELSEITRNANALATKLRPFGVNVENQLRMFSGALDRDWDQNAKVLSD